MSGVKQGDPLGPLLFCLTIHDSHLCILKKYPDLKIVGYMNDISIIGLIELLKRVAVEVLDIYETLGLSLNPNKCLLIGRSTQELFINGVQILFINYVEDAFRFLGCCLGNVPKISQELSNCLEKTGSELNTISSYDIEKHIKFCILKIYYSEKITHLLRSTGPSIALNFCRSFNELRINFLASLLEVDSTLLRSHLFTSAHFDGIGFTKSSILCKSAFLGGGKNFVFEFVNRFPNVISLINPNSCKY
ncbi:hypothetical protein GEMRC1_011527 [Eukaryota sp. GEM-RC1]